MPPAPHECHPTVLKGALIRKYCKSGPVSASEFTHPLAYTDLACSTSI